MLFVIAYNILNLVIDPDKNDKGSSIEKLLKNIVISFILIVICPSLFSFAFRVQNSILNTNGGIINNFFSSAFQENTGEDTIRAGGRRMATTTFSAFFTPSNEGNDEIKAKTKNKSYTLKNGTVVNCSTIGNCTLKQVNQASMELGTFSPYKSFAKNIVDEEVDFNWLIALIAGGYLVYVIVSFCFDLAVRACKLAFYQIIAPITITCRILPNQEDIFNKWFKATWKTYMALFIRILIMNLGIYLISVFIGKSNFFDSSACVDCSAGVKLIGNAFIILGIVTFIKQAPKLVDDIFGLGEDVSLGIKDKIKNAGVFTAGATLGAGATALTRNAVHGFKNVKDAEGGRAKFAAGARAIGSTFLGGASGAVRGFNSGRSASSASEMAAAAGKGAKGATDARDEREARKTRYKATGKNPVTRTFIGGHVVDWAANARDWATGGAESFTSTIEEGQKFKGLQDTYKSAADEVLKKLMNNTAVVYDTAKTKSTFKGSAEEKAAQEAIYDELFRLNGNKKFTIATAEEYVKQLSNQTFDAPKRADFSSEADYKAAVDRVNQLKLQNSQKVAAANSMLTQLKKNAQSIVINNRKNAAMFDLKPEHMEELDSAVTNFVNAYNDAGGVVKDVVTGKSYSRLEATAADLSDNLNDVSDAYVHNMQRANQDKQKYDDAAKARKGDK